MDPNELARTLKSALAPHSRSVPQPLHRLGHHVNPQGYTFSSTYNPLTQPSSRSSTFHVSPLPSSSDVSPPSGSRNFLPPRGAPPTHWYTPGKNKCTYSSCTFIGSPNSVQVHMMDRHLIYPPGWPTRKRQPDWDADPSLKGKPIPILGTNVRLDTPEEVAAWIAERKRRWPTAPRVAEKKRKLEEAMANGGLQPDYIALTGNKRFRQPPLFDPEVTRARRGRGGGAFTGRGRGRGGGGRTRGHGSADASRGRPPSVQAQQIQPLSIPATDMGPQQSVPGPPLAKNIVTDPGSDRDSGSDDGAPEEVSSKRRPPGIEAYGSSSDAEPEQPQPQAVSDHPQPRPTIPPSPSIDPTAAGPRSTLAKAQPIHHHPLRVPPPQPKKPPQNPFAARTSLLRNLLLPEIRMTVSNLSQAIHFLVDNDFLENVELKPGEANEKRIEVVGEQTTRPEAETSTQEDTELHTLIG